MKVVGLTGGIGMGKTTAAQWLASLGLPVSDSDDIAHGLVQPGQPALREIHAVFGPTVLTEDGRLCRDVLGRLVFADAPARRRLEEILHPRIRAIWRERLAGWRRDGRPLAITVIPLLFETKTQAELDAVLCVACTAQTQGSRLRARGWDSVEIARRNGAQMPVEEKMRLADVVIWNEAGMDVLRWQLSAALGIQGAAQSSRDGVGEELLCFKREADRDRGGEVWPGG